MKNRLGLILTTGFLLACGSGAWAMAPGTQLFNLNLGVGIPLSHIDLTDIGGGRDNIGTAGLAVGGEYVYYLSPYFALGFDGSYHDFGDKHSEQLSPVVDSTLRPKSTVALAIAKFPLLPDGPVLPYFLMGFGFHHSSLRYDATPYPGLEWKDTQTTESRTIMDDSGNNYALAFGLGVDVPLNERLFIGGEWRFQYLGNVHYSTNTQGQNLGLTGVDGSTSSMDLLARIGFRF